MRIRSGPGCQVLLEAHLEQPIGLVEDEQAHAAEAARGRDRLLLRLAIGERLRPRRVVSAR